MTRTTVLFLCTGNSCRSQLAEALLRMKAPDQFEVFSAGLEPKGINPFAIRVMDELGVDIRGQQSTHVDEYLGRHFNFVITVCGDADELCPQALWEHGGRKLHWPFDDPARFVGSEDETLTVFRRTRDDIAARIDAWLEG